MVPPIPDPTNIDLSKTLISITLFFFDFAVKEVLLTVAINRDPVSLAPNPLIVNSVSPALNWNLSSLNVSVVPSDRTKTYLSSSKGKNTKLVPDVMEFVELLVILIPSYSFLRITEEPVKSTDLTFLFGRGAKRL